MKLKLPTIVLPQLILLLFITQMPTTTSSSLSPYCTRSDSTCWPTDAEWSALSASLSGSVTPISSSSSYDVCYEQATDAFGLAEAGDGVCHQNHDCLYQFCAAEEDYESDLILPGGIVKALGVNDVKKALNFATIHNMAVTVKTSGHSFMGSGTGNDSLNIWMIHLDENDETSLLQQYSWSNSCTDGSPEKNVLRVGGGTFWKEAYLAGGFDVNVIGGGALSVGAAGGWLQGGGLSAQSPQYGLGLDQVLSFDLVLANGTEVTADECSNPDLYWALRGGGGGTFGVVTKVHYRVYDNPTTTSYVAARVYLDYEESIDYLAMVDKWIDFIVEKSATGIDTRWGGYWNLSGSVTFWFVGSLTDAEDTLIDEIRALRDSLPAILKPKFRVEVDEHKSYLDYRGGRYPDHMGTDATGWSKFYIGSWLVPKSDLDGDGIYTAKHTLKSIARTGFSMFNYLLGGAVNNVPPGDTAVHPVMRQAVWQLEVFQPTHMNLLIENFPNGAAGFNHHSKDLQDWRNNLWGENNYERLRDIKDYYDPNHLFNCFHCVGYSGKEPYEQDGLSTTSSGGEEENFSLLSSVRVTDESGYNVIAMRVGILEGPALGMNGPRFISSGPYDWKPMYSPGNTMVTFFRTQNSDFSKNTEIKVLKAEENGEEMGTVSTSGSNFNPTWNRGDISLPDSEKRVLWVRYEEWVAVDGLSGGGYAIRAGAYWNCVSCAAGEQHLLSSESVMVEERNKKRAIVLQETNYEYWVYGVGEWPMSSLHDGRILILRQFEAINLQDDTKFKRWSELYLLTPPLDASPTKASDYESVIVPPKWGDGWVHKIFFSAGENYVTYQRNGDEGEVHEMSSLCLAHFNINTLGGNSESPPSSVEEEDCFVVNNPTNAVTDWYARMTQDERHVVFSSNRPSKLKAGVDNLAYEPFRLYAYVMSTGDIVQLTPTYSFKNYWYPSTYGLTTFLDTNNSMAPSNLPTDTPSAIPSNDSSSTPTLISSTKPSILPSLHPTDSPTENQKTFIPTNKPVCTDSTTWRFSKGKKMHNCSWVKVKPNSRCSRIGTNGVDAKTACPIACENSECNTPQCKKKNQWKIKLNGEERNCKSLKKENKKKYCKKIGKVGIDKLFGYEACIHCKICIK